MPTHQILPIRSTILLFCRVFVTNATDNLQYPIVCNVPQPRTPTLQGQGSLITVDGLPIIFPTRIIPLRTALDNCYLTEIFHSSQRFSIAKITPYVENCSVVALLTYAYCNAEIFMQGFDAKNVAKCAQTEICSLTLIE